MCITLGCSFFGSLALGGKCSCCAAGLKTCVTPDCTQLTAKGYAHCMVCSNAAAWKAFEPELNARYKEWFAEWCQEKPYTLLDGHWAKQFATDFCAQPFQAGKLLARLQGKDSPWPVCALSAETAGELFRHNNKSGYDYNLAHVLAGFIVDKWRVKDAPQHFYCYYEGATTERPLDKAGVFAYWDRYMHQEPRM